MNTEACEKYEAVCRNIRTSMPVSCRWQWDGRFGAAMCVLEKKDSEKILTVMGTLFAGKWDPRTIRDAPKPVRTLVKNTFDIQAGQTLFASDVGNTVLLGAWWPWSNGVSISLRIGLFPLDREPLDPGDVRESLERWFGIDR